jgi:hypothetical protein
MRCELTSMCSSGQRLAGRSSHDRGTSAIGTRPDMVSRCGRTVPDGVGQWGEAAISALAHHIRTGAIG